jgi:glycosyltransferase involved in cell wall biosynthesis
MPTYNGMKFLPQAVESVLSQAFQDWELIISDDNSTDGTREFLSSLRDPRIQIHFQPKNLGIFGNLNFLFPKVKSEIVQILCQDDYFVDSDALSRLVERWSQMPSEIAFLRSNHRLDINSRHEALQARVLPSIIDPQKSDLLFFVFGCIPGNLSNVSVRAQAIEDAGWFRTDLPYAGDFEFWSRLGRLRKWAIANIAVTHVRSHQQQASVTLNRQGEVISQLGEILSILYRNLVAKGYSPTLLRVMATINYTARARDRGVKDLMSGKGFGYLLRVQRELDCSCFSFGRVFGWLAFVCSAGGRVFTVSASKILLNRAEKHTGCGS